MRMTGSRAYTRPTPVPKMPTGLVELMEGMTKEVLTCNPLNVYEFCAAHMLHLLEIRDGPTKRRILTLEQKISRAQQKNNLRAQERRQKYDKEMQLLLKSENANEDEELLVQTNLCKLPLTQVMHLNSVEEMEISRCKNNKEFGKNEHVIAVDKETSKSQDSNLNSGSENVSILFNNEITELVEDEHVDDVIELYSALAPTQSAEIKENNEVIENSLVSAIVENEKQYDSMTVKEIVKQSDELPLTTIEYVDTPIVDQDQKKDLKKNSINYEDVCGDKNINDTTKNKTINEITENKKNENIVPAIKEDYLINNLTTKNSMYEQSLSVNSNTPVKNDTGEDKNNLKEKCNETMNISKNDNSFLLNPSTSTGNQEVSEVALDIHSDGIQNDEVQTLNKISHTTDNAISMGSALSIVNPSVPNLHPLGKETVTDIEQGIKICEEEKVCEKNYISSHLCSNIPPISVNCFENSNNPVSNDNCGASNMDLETAAITIQKVFRSFLFKTRASNETNSIDEDIKEANGYSSANLSNERRPLGITRMDTMLQTVNEEKSLSLSTDDSSTISSAATIIQAHIRGFLIRSKLNSNKTTSTNSILNSEDPITPSTESETNKNNNKTVLNIHIVPDSIIPSLSRDESIVTSMDLSLDGSPPSSINLHPLGYDKSEPRKQLKREDAIQSISPPSNNSGKQSEDVDSAKEILINGVASDFCSKDNFKNDNEHAEKFTIVPDVSVQDIPKELLRSNSKDKSLADTKSESIIRKRNSLTKMSSDEMDVVTACMQNENERAPDVSNTQKLIHSGELHDVVLPTNVSRGSTSVVRGE